MTANCLTCKQPMASEDDCGGDCTRCMADAGDPDCIAVMYGRLKTETLHLQREIDRLRGMMDHSCGVGGSVVYGTKQAIADIEQRLAPTEDLAAMRTRSDAWHEVSQTLMNVCPDLMVGGVTSTGLATAVHAINTLAASRVPTPPPSGYLWRHSANEKWQYSSQPCGWEWKPIYDAPHVQPAGRVVGYMDPALDFMLPRAGECVLMGKVELWRSPQGKWTKPLYDAPYVRPDCNALLTLDSGVQVPLIRDGENYRIDPAIGQAAGWESLAGYFEDGSADTLCLWPDDATRTWHVSRGVGVHSRQLGYGSTIAQALREALKGEQE